MKQIYSWQHLFDKNKQYAKVMNILTIVIIIVVNENFKQNEYTTWQNIKNTLIIHFFHNNY